MVRARFWAGSPMLLGVAIQSWTACLIAASSSAGPAERRALEVALGGGGTGVAAGGDSLAQPAASRLTVSSRRREPGRARIMRLYSLWRERAFVGISIADNR